MNRYVTVKSNKYGLIFYLKPDVAFETLRREIERTFKGTAHFFGNSRLAVSFEGRILTKDQEQQLIETISESAQIDIVCIIDTDEKREKMYKRAVTDILEDTPKSDGIFCKGTLHKNQILECEKSIIILGNVEKGATVAAKGNIVILGTLYGNAYAGIGGFNQSFILSLAMQPQKIKIGNVKIQKKQTFQKDDMYITPQIAIVEENELKILPFYNSKQSIQED